MLIGLSLNIPKKKIEQKPVFVHQIVWKAFYGKLSNVFISMHNEAKFWVVQTYENLFQFEFKKINKPHCMYFFSLLG